MKTIKQLRHDVEFAEKALDKSNVALHEALLVKYGVRPGDIVVSHKGKEYKVTKVDTMFDDGLKPFVAGIPRKKDGTFGTAHRNLYSDWKKKP